jgi:hypothetical protein
MSQSLFFEPVVHFEKTGGTETMMTEDPNGWPGEIIQELFRQVPYISDFEPQVILDKTEGERGYAFGHIEVSNKTEIQHGAPGDAMSAAGIKSARIPIVIKDRKLQPLDLLVTDGSEVLPLTESRLRQAIFRPQAFDITGRGPGDMSMIGQLYPPYRQNYGFGGGGASMSVGMGKEGTEKEALNMSTIGSYLKKQTDPAGLAHASKSLLGRGAQQVAGGAAEAGQKKLLAGNIAAQRMAKAAEDEMPSLLEAIRPTLNTVDVNRFFGKIANDKGLEAQFVSHAVFTKTALEKLAAFAPSLQEKRAEAFLERLKPTVVQLRKEAEGYVLKTAAAQFWLPKERLLNRGEAVHALGEKVVLATDMTGSSTMTLGEGAEGEGEPGEAPELISQYGIYKVQDETGKHLVGYVFPNLIDIDGQALPIALFTNGSQMAVQGEIVGVAVSEGAELFESHPNGLGTFYRVGEDGHAQATVPMTVNASVADAEQGGVLLHGETWDGRQVQISVQPNIEEVTPGPDGDHLIIPDTFSWMPLEQAENTALIGNPEEFSKEGEARRKLATVTVRTDGQTFSFRGLPIEKLASEQTDFISMDDALFLLGALGTDLDYATKKLGEAAAFSRPVDIRVSRFIKTAQDRMRETIVESAQKLATVDVSHLRFDLSKEAAVIPDPVAVDTVLSLGFLNPENLGVFISYLPAIDQSQKKMCELLLAARLGLREIPIPALEKAVRTTEEAIEGLKILGFQQS